MIGNNNHFFGKKHLEETKLYLRKLKGTHIKAINEKLENIYFFDSIKQASKNLKINETDVKKYLENGKIHSKKKIYFKYC